MTTQSAELKPRNGTKCQVIDTRVRIEPADLLGAVDKPSLSRTTANKLIDWASVGDLDGLTAKVLAQIAEEQAEAALIPEQARNDEAKVRMLSTQVAQVLTIINNFTGTSDFNSFLERGYQHLLSVSDVQDIMPPFNTPQGLKIALEKVYVPFLQTMYSAPILASEAADNIVEEAMILFEANLAKARQERRGVEGVAAASASARIEIANIEARRKVSEVIYANSRAIRQGYRNQGANNRARAAGKLDEFGGYVEGGVKIPINGLIGGILHSLKNVIDEHPVTALGFIGSALYAASSGIGLFNVWTVGFTCLGLVVDAWVVDRFRKK